MTVIPMKGVIPCGKCRLCVHQANHLYKGTERRQFFRCVQLQAWRNKQIQEIKNSKMKGNKP